MPLAPQNPLRYYGLVYSVAKYRPLLSHEKSCPKYEKLPKSCCNLWKALFSSRKYLPPQPMKYDLYMVVKCTYEEKVRWIYRWWLLVESLPEVRSLRMLFLLLQKRKLPVNKEVKGWRQPAAELLKDALSQSPPSSRLRSGRSWRTNDATKTSSSTSAFYSLTS